MLDILKKTGAAYGLQDHLTVTKINVVYGPSSSAVSARPTVLPVPQPTTRQRKSQFGETSKTGGPLDRGRGDTGGDAVTIRTRDLPPSSPSASRPSASREITRRDARIASIRPRNRPAAASPTHSRESSAQVPSRPPLFPPNSCRRDVLLPVP